MTKFNKLPRRLALLAVLLASLFVFAESPTGARACPDIASIPEEPSNPCEQRCIDQFNKCMSDGISFYICDSRRNCCLYYCGS